MPWGSSSRASTAALMAPLHPTSTPTGTETAEAPVRGEGARLPPVMADLDVIFKAYDIRGTVPDQLDAAHVPRASASASPLSPARRAILVGPRHAARRASSSSRAFAEGVTRAGRRRRRPRPGVDRPRLLRRRAPRRARRDVHRLAQPGPVQRHQAVPGRRPARRRRTPAWPRSRRLAAARARRRRPAPAATRARSHERPARRVRRPRRVVRRPVACCARCKVVADTANGMGGLVVPGSSSACPFELEIMYGELDGTFPNHPADPIQPANQRDLQARVVDRRLRRRPGLRRRRRPRVRRRRARPTASRARPRRRCSPRPCWRKHPGATILHNLICSKAVPEVIREHGGMPDPHQGRPLVHQGRSWPRPAPCSAASTRRTTTSATTTGPTPGSSPRCSCSSMLSTAERAAVGVRKPFERYAASGEINTQVDDPPRRDRAGRRRLRRRRSRTGSTASRSTAATWWFNLRPSNTEPLLRLNLEAPTRDECDSAVAEVLGLIDRAQTGRPDMALRPAAARDPRLPRGQGPAATTSQTRTSLYNPRLQPPLPRSATTSR